MSTEDREQVPDFIPDDVLADLEAEARAAAIRRRAARSRHRRPWWSPRFRARHLLLTLWTAALALSGVWLSDAVDGGVAFVVAAVFAVAAVVATGVVAVRRLGRRPEHRRGRSPST